MGSRNAEVGIKERRWEGKKMRRWEEFECGSRKKRRWEVKRVRRWERLVAANYETTLGA